MTQMSSLDRPDISFLTIDQSTVASANADIVTVILGIVGDKLVDALDHNLVEISIV